MTTKTKTKTKTIKPSTEDLILGAKEETKVVQDFDYLSPNVKYNVKIHQNGREVQVNGREIGAFLGVASQEKNALKEGAKKVFIKDDKNKPIYDIEVIE